LEKAENKEQRAENKEQRAVESQGPVRAEERAERKRRENSDDGR
jgi:hypothetical protein